MKNEVHIEVDIVCKVFKNNKYENEKLFYLCYQNDFDFIPKLIDFKDDMKMLIFENVGSPVKKKDIDFKRIKELNDKLLDAGIYHNDWRTKNIIYDSVKDKYYIIDFELWDNKRTDFRKVSEEQDIRKNIL
jgi:tRNA A-37 threonylcarbamoyl transferase component Bud32